ncbi:MAG: MerR family transcriptional regulator [Bacteroidia bacterium]
MPEIPHNPEKLFYTIGEVADIFQVNHSLIRFWEKEFPSIKPKKNKKGNRLFTAADLDIFKRIYTLVKEQGFTLEGARQQLKAPNAEAPKATHEVLIQKLKTARKALVELRESL